jgi:hypothetical protein
MRSKRVCVALAALWLLSGCAKTGRTAPEVPAVKAGEPGKTEASGKAGSSQAVSGGESAGPEPAPGSKPELGEQVQTSAPGLEATKPVVKLLNPGEAPRKALRYHFTEGKTETLVMDMKMSMNMQSDGQSLFNMSIPVVRVVMVFDDTRLSKEGSLHYNFRVTSTTLVDVGPNPAPQLTQLSNDLKVMEGLSGWALVTPRGETIDFHLNDPPPSATSQQSIDQMVANMRKSMNNVSAPLPEEPVGRGAQWEVTMPLRSKEFSGTQIATYTLSEVKGDTGRLDVKLVQQIPKENVSLPPTPAGTTMSLDSLSSSGVGIMLYDLDDLLPRSSVAMKMVFEMSAADQNERHHLTMTMGFDLGIHGEGKESPAAPRP